MNDDLECLYSTMVCGDNQQLERLLVAHPDLVNARDDKGETPIYKIDNPNVLRLLIAHGADLQIRNNDARTPLMAAASMCKVEKMKLLLDAGADVQAQDAYGSTVIDIAFWLGGRGTWMVEKDYMRGSFGILDPYFLPWLHPFFVAVFQRLQPEVTRLLAAGADPNMERPNGATPLDWAVRLKEIDLVRLLLAQGADPNHRDSTGATPFIRAGVMGAGNLVLLLLAHGGDPTIQDQSGITVLYGIAANCNRDGDTVHLLDTLVAAGADPCPQDPSGWTVLHSAARHDPEVVAFLIAHGCDVNARWEFNGETPLLKAIQQDQLESVQMLLQAGADPNAQSYEGAIPLVKALWQSCEYQTLEVCQLLLEYGADLDLPNCNGMTARRYMREALREGRTCYPEQEAFFRRYA